MSTSRLLAALLGLSLLFAAAAARAQTNYAQWFDVVESGFNTNINDVATDTDHLYLNGSYFIEGTFLGQALPEYGSANAFVGKTDLDGNLVWMATMGGEDIDSFFDLTLDSQGNPVLTGYSTSQGGVEINGELVIEAGNPDEFRTIGIVAKFSAADGSLIWLSHWTSAEFAAANPIKLAVDSQDNVYVGGYYSADFEFDGIQFDFSQKGFGEDMFMLKLDGAGAGVWGQTLAAVEDGGFINMRAVAVNQNGPHFAFSYYKPLLVNGVPLPHVGEYYWLAIVQPNPDTGVVQDHVAFGSQTGGQDFSHLKADGDGNLVATGFFQNNTGFSVAGIPLSGYGPVEFSEDGFVAKFDANLDPVWAKDMGGDYLDRAFNVDLSATGSIYVGGGFDSFTAFNYAGVPVIAPRDPNALSMFQMQLDPDGDLVAVLALHGQDTQTAVSNNRSVVLPDGTVYTAGRVLGGVWFTPSDYHLADHPAGFVMKWLDRLPGKPEGDGIFANGFD
jgi:hypothetical protein